MVTQARNDCYSNIGSIIFHPQMWDGTKNTRHEFYETEHFRKWWGLHLKNAARELMRGNIMKIFNWIQDVQQFQDLLWGTTISKEIISAVITNALYFLAPIQNWQYLLFTWSEKGIDNYLSSILIFFKLHSLFSDSILPNVYSFEMDSPI